MRRLGFDVEAMPYPDEYETNQVVSGLESFKKPNGEEIKPSPMMGKEKLLEEMQHAPDGSLFVLSGEYYLAGQNNMGHAWCAEKINGKLYFIDPQSNETDVEYYLEDYRKLRYFRADKYIFNSDPSFNWSGVIKGSAN